MQYLGESVVVEEVVMVGLRLSLAEREEISRGMSCGESCRSLAQRLGRAPSTITREVKRHGCRHRYRALVAAENARVLARRPKIRKLAACPRLQAEVHDGLRKRWAPTEIAGRLRRKYPDDPEMWVSHETIYKSLYVTPRGPLRREWTQHLRKHHQTRRPRSKLRVDGRGRIPEMVMIDERPVEVDDRAVPGHWEGDLILGAGKLSSIGTLVERTSRYTMLLHLPNDRSPETVRAELARVIGTLPEHLRRSLTWDQGMEMAQHKQFTIETGIPVYFCDASSPWQRGTNENTNGLLRQYFPKKTDLRVHTRDELERVAIELNGRPRRMHDWMTPSEVFAELIATAP
jgi:transposase, IS30 family